MPRKNLVYSEQDVISTLASIHNVPVSRISVVHSAGFDDGPRGYSPASFTITVDVTDEDKEESK